MSQANSSYKISAFGELLMDMTPVSTPLGRAFVPNPGGAPCNFLAMASKMGCHSKFFGKVGEDQFGRDLEKAALAAGINTEGLVIDKSVPTTLAFVHLDDSGDRSFSFYRKACADVSLSLLEVNQEAFCSSNAVYYGSLALTDEPLKSTAKALIEVAKNCGKILCCDPNYRPALWESEVKAVEAMVYCVSQADIVKVSEEEALLLTSEEDLMLAGNQLLALGPKLVLITQGEKGSVALTKAEKVSVPALKVNCMDTTGAGDAFFGAFIGALLQMGIEKTEEIDSLNEKQLIELLKLGNAAAGLCVTKYGAIPALPSREEVLKAVLDIEI